MERKKKKSSRDRGKELKKKKTGKECQRRKRRGGTQAKGIHWAMPPKKKEG